MKTIQSRRILNEESRKCKGSWSWIWVNGCQIMIEKTNKQKASTFILNAVFYEKYQLIIIFCTIHKFPGQQLKHTIIPQKINTEKVKNNIVFKLFISHIIIWYQSTINIQLRKTIQIVNYTMITNQNANTNTILQSYNTSLKNKIQ